MQTQYLLKKLFRKLEANQRIFPLFFSVPLCLCGEDSGENL